MQQTSGLVSRPWARLWSVSGAALWGACLLAACSFRAEEESAPNPHGEAAPLALAPALSALPAEAPRALELFFRRNTPESTEELHLSPEVAEYLANNSARPVHQKDTLLSPMPPGALDALYRELAPLLTLEPGPRSAPSSADGARWSVVFLIAGRSYQPRATSPEAWEKAYRVLSSFVDAQMQAEQLPWSLEMDVAALPAGASVWFEGTRIFPAPEGAASAPAVTSRGSIMGEGTTTEKGVWVWKTRLLPGSYEVRLVSGESIGPGSVPASTTSQPAPLARSVVRVGVSDSARLGVVDGRWQVSERTLPASGPQAGGGR